MCLKASVASTMVQVFEGISLKSSEEIDRRLLVHVRLGVSSPRTFRSSHSTPDSKGRGI